MRDEMRRMERVIGLDPSNRAIVILPAQKINLRNGIPAMLFL